MKFTSATIASVSVLLASIQLASSAPVSTSLSTRAAGNALTGQRDNTATRALSDVSIKIFDGRCLSVDAASSDHVEEADIRAVSIPSLNKDRDIFEDRTAISFAKCDGSKGQKFDVITKGLHNDQVGNSLIVSTATQTCLTSDRRHSIGRERPPPFDEVFLAPCGGANNSVSINQLFTDGRQGNLGAANKPVQISPLIAEDGDLSLVADVVDKLGFTGDRTSSVLQLKSKSNLFTFVQ